MRPGVYVEVSSQSFLTSADGAEWGAGTSSAPFRLHPSGIPVFAALDPDSDEYLQGDPYGVHENFDTPFQARRREVTLQWLVEVESPLRRLLDVGCGEGHISALLRSLPRVDLVCAADYSLAAVLRGFELYPEIEFCVCDAQALPFANEYFDAVICNNLWEHVEAPMHLLAEMRRVLRPEGYLLISTPNRYRFENLLRMIRRRPAARMSRLHVTEFSAGQMREMLDWGEFELLRSGSPPIPPAAPGWRRWIVPGLKAALTGALRLLRSEHSLEATAFYLARRRQSRASNAPTLEAVETQ